MSKELEQKLDAALEAIDQQKVEIDALKEQVAKLAESASSVRISNPAKPVKKVLQDPGVQTVTDADGKKVKVRFALLNFSVSTAGGSVVRHLAEDVAKNPALVQELYENHPPVFKPAK